MKTIKFLLLSLILHVSGFAYNYELSVCAIFQNEAPYIKEWIDYHLHVVVEHFWLYNNDSQDDFRPILQPYIDSGIVEIIEWPGSFRQPEAYQDAIPRCKGKTKWLAIIDLDEYIVPKKFKDIRKVIRRYFKRYGAIYAHWLQFGTGGVNVGPGHILPYLTKCANIDHDWNRIGKSIIRLDALENIGNEVHLFKLKPPYKYADGSANEWCGGLHAEKYLRINHYTYRDEWYFWNTKIARIKKWGMEVD